MRRWQLFAALVLAGLGGWSLSAASMEEPNSIVTMDEICGLMACRQPTTVRIRGTTAAADADLAIPRAPHVFQGVINLVAGERNAYLLDVRDDEVRDIRSARPPQVRSSSCRSSFLSCRHSWSIWTSPRMAWPSPERAGRARKRNGIRDQP